MNTLNKDCYVFEYPADPVSEACIMDAWKEGGAPVVTILCHTFNQISYVKDALNSFLMQETDFPFEIIIHDDCSTDGTVEILEDYRKRYPNIIRLILQKENQYSKGRMPSTFTFCEARGEYVAICEGDDFWIDKYKLKRQCEVLRGCESVGLVHSNCLTLTVESGETKQSLVPGKSLNFETLILGNRIQTLTIMIRRSLLNLYMDEMAEHRVGWLMGDFPLWLFCARHSKVKMIPEVTAVYRVLSESASHSKNDHKMLLFARSYFEIKLFFYKYYNLKSEAILRKIYSAMLTQALIYNDKTFIDAVPEGVLSWRSKMAIFINGIYPLSRIILRMVKIKKRLIEKNETSRI